MPQTKPAVISESMQIDQLTRRFGGSGESGCPEGIFSAGSGGVGQLEDMRGVGM